MTELLGRLALVTLVLSCACLAVMALRDPLRRMGGSGLAYALWLAVPVILLACLAPALPHASASIPVSPPLGAFIQLPPAAGVASLPAKTAPAIWAWMAPTVTLAWLIGLCCWILRILSVQKRFVRALGRLSRDPQRPNVFYSARPGVSPSVIGLIRPRIILPADFDRLYSPEEQALILAHEGTHVRALHLPTGAVGLALLTTQWFNPLAHLAFAFFRLDQEMACDAAVVAAHPKSRALYARTMLKAGANRASSPLACCWSSALPLPMKTRIRLLMVAPASRTLSMTVGIGIGALTLAAACGTYAMTPHSTLRFDMWGPKHTPSISTPIPTTSQTLATSPTSAPLSSATVARKRTAAAEAQDSDAQDSGSAVLPAINNAATESPNPAYVPPTPEEIAASERVLLNPNTQRGAFALALLDLLNEDERVRGIQFASPTLTTARVNGRVITSVTIGRDRTAGPDGAELSRKISELQARMLGSPTPTSSAINLQAGGENQPPPA